MTTTTTTTTTTKPVIVISTFPDKDSLANTANQIVKEKLAACVNVIDITSTFFWEGKIENTPEYLALFKTTEKNKEALKERIDSTHPYDVPEIAEIMPSSLNEPYLKWLIESTSATTSSSSSTNTNTNS